MRMRKIKPAFDHVPDLNYKPWDETLGERIRGCFHSINLVVGWIAFLGCWVWLTVVGDLAGLAFGWIPAGIVGLLVYALWMPVVLLITVAMTYLYIVQHPPA